MEKYIIYFIIYSFIGWFMEVCVSLYTKKRFVNRGFLIGPYCPIYGCGVLTIVTLVGNESDVLTVFLKSIFICSILEYFTSYFMEKIYHVRWWDYSNKKFNINGRICLETMIPFGILGTSVVFLLHPFIVEIINNLSVNTIHTIALIILIVFIIDNIISTYILLNIKGQIKGGRVDNTEKIKKYIEKWIEKNSYFYRRIKDSFPKFQVYIKNQKDRLKKYSKGRKK